MKILFVAPTFPWPLAAGGQVRLYHLLKGLSSEHDITLIGPIQDNSLKSHVENFCRLRMIPVGQPGGRLADPDFWMRWVRRALLILKGLPPAGAVHFRPELAKLLEGAAHEDFDIINFVYIDTAAYLNYLAGTKSKLVLDTVHIATVTARRQFMVARGLPAKLFAFIHWKTMSRFERRQNPRFDTILTCSEIDAAETMAMTPDMPVAVIPNAVDESLLEVSRRPSPNPELLFIGGTHHEPNVDGLRFFMEGCWEALRVRFSDISLKIVGEGWKKEAWPADYAGVDRLGYVPDLKTVLMTPTLFIAPIRFGSGTRLKILESMAAGLPLVGTSVSVEGIAVTPGRDALVADNPADLVDAIARLISDARLARRIGAAGQTLIKDKYLWTNSVSLLNDVYSRLMSTEKDRVYA